MRSTIRGDVGRHSEAGDPGGEEGCGTGCGGGFVERDSFHPASRAVNDRENVCVSLGGWKGANEVDVDVGETAVRDGNGGGSEMDMAVNLGALAGEAFTGPSGDILGEGLPNKTGGDEAAGGTAARMRDIVEQGEHGAAEGGADADNGAVLGFVGLQRDERRESERRREAEVEQDDELNERRKTNAVGEPRGGPSPIFLSLCSRSPSCSTPAATADIACCCCFLTSPLHSAQCLWTTSGADSAISGTTTLSRSTSMGGGGAATSIMGPRAPPQAEAVPPQKPHVAMVGRGEVRVRVCVCVCERESERDGASSFSRV